MYQRTADGICKICSCRNLNLSGSISFECSTHSLNVSSSESLVPELDTTYRAELLYGIAADFAEPEGKSVIDLYCGTGTIGLSMAKRAKRVVGIEIVEEAVECANMNAKLNGIDNAEFYAGDASDTEGLLESVEKKSGKKIDADVVIMDPPRKGSTPELIGYLARRGVTRVVYVSCDPDTLARDCAEFLKYGYKMSEVIPVNMFPRTGHVENVVCLTRK